jgi:tetratricopeptide (TPR) repeat protein
LFCKKRFAPGIFFFVQRSAFCTIVHNEAACRLIRQVGSFLVIAFLLFADPPRDLLQSGLAAMAQGHLTEARSDLEQARTTQPSNPQVWLALTEVYAMQKDEAQRESAAQRAIELAHAANGWESSASVRNYLGKVYLANAEFAQAIGEYREAVRLGPYEESYRFDLAQALLGHEEFGPAAEALEDARKIFSRSAQIELALGVAYYGQRRFPEAVNSFLRTIELSPEVAQPYVFLGKMLDQAGDRLPEIQRRFAEFQNANPENPTAYLLRAKAMAAAGEDAAEVEKLLRKSIALKNDGWESHYELGVLLEGKRDFAAAADELERSAELNPDVSATHYHLARVYDRLQRPQDAARERARHAELTAHEKVTAGMEPVP